MEKKPIYYTYFSIEFGKERKNDDEKSVIPFFPNNRREENISSSWEKSEY